MATITKSQLRERRHRRLRAKISGTIDMPRLAIFRSNLFIYAQIINDDEGKTIVSAKGKDASSVGKDIAEKAISKGISKVVFDRGGYQYLGKIKILAESARQTGLKF